MDYVMRLILVARLVGDRLATALGQPVVIESVLRLLGVRGRELRSRVTGLPLATQRKHEDRVDLGYVSVQGQIAA